jgi:hypothetical protein
MRRLYNFGACTPIFHINAEALVRFWTLWAWMQANKSNIASASSFIGTANLMIQIIEMMNFVTL